MGFVFSLILFAVTLLLSEILKSRQREENAKPPGLGDFNFPTATEGRPIPIVWGTVKLSGPNVVWYGDLRSTSIIEKVKTGLFSSQKVRRGFRYNLGIQMALCRGVDSVRRIFVDDELLYDTPVTTDSSVTIDAEDFFGGIEEGQGGISGTVTFRLGSQTQTVPAYLAQFQSIGGDTPAYRGTTYVLLENVYLGTSTTIKPWQFEVRRIPNGLGLITASVNSGNDANPMNVIYELLTNTEWGLGFPAADVDTTRFAAAAEVLRQEGNGFSFVLDSAIEAGNLLDEIQRQIDGVIFLNRTTGKWDVKLARDDYDIDNVPLIEPDNLVSVEDYTRGAWTETVNIVNIEFSHRARQYQTTYAVAQDSANIRIQGGQIVKSQFRFPGVKDPSLASQIAWRELRTSSYPLAKARLTVDRSFSALNPGDVVAWTDPDLGFTKLPMRVTRIDLGQLDQGRVVLDMTQDVFVAVTPSFSAPGAGAWEPLVDEVVDIPLADRLVFEAPRAFVDRDPERPGLLDRVWLGFRYQNDGATGILVRDSNQVEVGTVAGFLVAGELASALPASYITAGTLTIDADPDTKAELLAEIEAVTTKDVGDSLANLLVIGSEFLGFTGFSDPGGNQITLTGVVRGLLDSTPPVVAHAAGTRVWLAYVVGALTESTFAAGSSPSLRPLPRSATDELAFADATASSLSMSNRARRPYPPIRPRVLSTSAYTGGPFSIDQSGVIPGAPAGENDDGVPFSFVRRDFRLADEYLKVLNEDSLPADFPTANTTEYRVEVRKDPSGTNTLLYTSAWASTNAPGVSRNAVLGNNDGVVPSRLRVSVETRHVVDGDTYEATQKLAVDFDITSSLSSLTNLGARATGVASAVFVAPDTGSYTLSIGAAVPSGEVQVRINGGAWTTVISGSETSDTFAATSGDDLEFRHTGSSSPGSYRFLRVSPPTAADAYAILVY